MKRGVNFLNLEVERDGLDYTCKCMDCIPHLWTEVVSYCVGRSRL